MVQLARIRRMLDEFSDDSEGDDEFYAELANEAGCDRPPTQRDSPRGVGDRSLSMSNSMGGGASSMAHWQPVSAGWYMHMVDATCSTNGTCKVPG